jgi:hypothetical protein
MFKKISVKKVEKIIKKALKIVNKEIYNDRRLLGRYIIRDCYHQVKYLEKDGFLLSYCFEYIDKATQYRHFFAFGSAASDNEITIDRFVKKLRLLLNDFMTRPIPKHLDKKIEKKDFRKVKID